MFNNFENSDDSQFTLVEVKYAKDYTPEDEKNKLNCTRKNFVIGRFSTNKRR